MSNGIAFGGGGLKVFAHIGVIRALKELKINFDGFSGTSSGSIMALFYALDYSEEFMKSFITQEYENVIKVKKAPIVKSIFRAVAKGDFCVNSLINSERIEETINKALTQTCADKQSISDIDKKLAIISCDTISTKEVIFISNNIKMNNTDRTTYINEAPIGKAVRASMSFPGIFSPCDYKEFNLIDGGTVNNLPSKVLKDLENKKVLGVVFKNNKYIPKDSIMDVALRASDIFSILNTKVAKSSCDFVLELDIPDTGLLSVSDIDKVINKAYVQTMESKDEIIKIFGEEGMN